MDNFTKKLIELRFKEYEHKTGYRVWSIKDLTTIDNKKEWYLV